LIDGAGYRQAALNLGTDRYKRKIVGQGPGYVAIVLVPAVKPDLVPEEAGADSNFKFTVYAVVHWHTLGADGYRNSG